MKTLISFILIIFCCNFQVLSQEPKGLKDIFSVQGYVKFLPSVSYNDDFFLTNNLIHNRINILGHFGDNWTLKMELRNRLFYGEQVRMNSSFSKLIDQKDGLIDLSLIWRDKESVVGHSILDRAQINYAKGKWDITFGRQRINWGIALLWNSNDLFNAYNFVDFDYTERPGSDAIRIQYYTTDFSSIELAINPGKDINHSIIAGLYKFNKWNYDFQVLTGNYNRDLVLGIGWAGNIKQLGFKGETTYFHPKNEKHSNEALSSTIALDYAFKKGLYLNYSILISTLGENKLPSGGILFLYNSDLSPKNLMPTKVSHFLQSSYTFNPMISSSMSIIYGQGADFLFIMPNVTYSIKENWDLDLTFQLFYGPINDEFQNIINSIFLRFQYSF